MTDRESARSPENFSLDQVNEILDTWRLKTMEHFTAHTIQAGHVTQEVYDSLAPHVKALGESDIRQLEDEASAAATEAANRLGIEPDDLEDLSSVIHLARLRTDTGYMSRLRPTSAPNQPIPKFLQAVTTLSSLTGDNYPVDILEAEFEVTPEMTAEDATAALVAAAEESRVIERFSSYNKQVADHPEWNARPIDYSELECIIDSKRVAAEARNLGDDIWNARGDFGGESWGY